MSGIGVIVDLRSALDAAHAAVDKLQTASLDSCPTPELLEAWRELERLARRLPAVEARLVLEAETRNLPGEAGCRSTGQFLRGLLRVDSSEAHARVESAYAIGERRTVTGEPLPPAYPAVAAAQAVGSISPRHARVVTKLIEELPDQARAESGEQVERDLVGYADRFDPRGVAKLAAHIRDCLDPDGSLEEAAYRDRCRSLTLRRRADGSGTLSGELTAECAERLDVLFDSLAAPKPAGDDAPDPRTATQRRHDAMLELLARTQATDVLPKTRGVSATVVLTMTTEQYLTGKGLTRTGHGALVPTSDALAWAGADHCVLALVLDSMKGVTYYSSLQRIFTEPQRLALYARDGGCTFPGCDAPPEWAEVHHVIEHVAGGPTSLDNAALACKHHHRRSIAEGWTAELTNGRVGWKPPPWIDPAREPRFNDLHQLR